MAFVPADQVETLVAKVADLFRNAEARLLARMAESVAKGIDSPRWAEEQQLRLARYRRQSEQTLQQLRRGLNAASGDSAFTAAARGQASALATLGKALTPDAAAAGRTVDTEAVMRLAGELTRTLDSAALPILRVTDDAYRKVIADVAHRTILGEATQQQAAQDALNEFARRGITSFVGRTGRRMRIEHYVEMATRTALMNATAQGHIDRLRDMGTRLVVVSDVPQECAKCRPFEGKVLALDDANMDTIADGQRVQVFGTLAEARSEGLFHPGCRHSIAPWRRNMRSFGETADPQGDKDRQRLRYLERQVRAARREELVALDDEARKAARRKAAAWQARIRQHVASTSAKRQPERERITAQFRPPALTPPPVSRSVAKLQTPTAAVRAKFDEVPLAGDVLRGQQSDRLTEHEKGTLESYAGLTSEQTNKALRGQIPMTPEIRERVETIRGALAKYPTAEAMRVTRELDGTTLNLTANAASLDHLIGAQIVEDGFMSTSTRGVAPRRASRPEPIELELLVPPGTPALRLGMLNDFDAGESEALVMDGVTYVILAAYKLPKGEQRGSRMWRILAAIIPKEPS
ncbi:phage minor capsid protein [Tsukamurella sp. NPDC003166]|uniref:phage minor capsid protein n=1 Tax=Tsukamurella sp. NPDC003166 TaxID=3154444 RepID=UPI0033ABA4E6